PDVDSIRSNLAEIFFITQDSKNYFFDFERFVPGEAVTTTWRLEVLDKMKDAVAFIKFVDRAGNDTLIKVEYFAPKFELSPGEYVFNQLKLGEQGTKQFIVKNTSTTGPIMITAISLQEGTQNFTMDIEGGLTFPYSLPAQQEIKINITFTASGDGNYRDLIHVWDDCENMLEAELKGRVGTPVILVNDHDYGKIRVGQKVAVTLNIQNTGSSKLIVTGYTTPSSVYEVDYGRAISAASPLVLDPGGQFPFKVYFTPSAEQSYPDQIVFESDAEVEDNIAVLNGTGIMPKLWTSSYKWEKLRIHRDAFPAGPYSTTEAIKLLNDGTDEVTISEVQILENINGDAFQLNGESLLLHTDVFKFMKVAPKNENNEPGYQFVKVDFLPTVTGEHKLVLKFI
ncbi:MAG: choice-of-anchor D domain-containing protein, partial [Bacteroidales bacterium]|nr:choice-of-anchor D domain-containing protein [Bacteroidales bacterium]